jgi:hypothetical protein
LQNEIILLADVPLAKNGEPQPNLIVQDRSFLLNHILCSYSKNNATGNEAEAAEPEGL